MMTNGRSSGCCQYTAGQYHTTQEVLALLLAPLLLPLLLLAPLLLLLLLALRLLLLLTVAVMVALRLLLAKLPGPVTPCCLLDDVC
jgi:hypothetical protein